ncbi:hypothetical protein ACHAWX_004609 [Stephanocyclus meneghinianus]
MATSTVSAPAPPTILITGASGMLGRALHRLLIYESNEYNVIGLGFSRLEVNHYHEYFPPPTPTKHYCYESKIRLHGINLLDYEETSTFLRRYNPDIIVHCAAERYPDAFETNLAASFQLNVDATKHLAYEILRLGDENKTNARKKPYLIYISTSYVFDGGVSSMVYPYKPGSTANPINNYGRSKWEGECAIRDILNKEEGLGQGVIVRVPLLYGEDCVDLNESPALEMMKVHLPQNRCKDKVTPEIKKIDDWALRFPTSVEDVAKVLKLMIAQLLKGSNERAIHSGTYHVASPHGCTKYNLLQLQSKILGISRDVVEKRAVGDSSGPPATSAPRPQCTQLDCCDTWKAMGQTFNFVTLEEGMERALFGFPERFMHS